MHSLKINFIRILGTVRRITESVFVRQVGTTILTQCAILIMSLATAAITARWLGPTGKGQLTLIFMAPTLLQMFLNAGLGPANVFFIGSKRMSVDQLSGNSVMFSIVGTMIGGLLILPILMSDLLFVLLPGIPLCYLMFGMMALPLGLLNVNLSAIIQGLRRIYTLNMINLMGALLSVVFMAGLLVGLKSGLWGAVMASLIVQMAILAATVWSVKREGARFIPVWSREIIRPTLGYGLQSYMANLLQFFNYRLDVLIVNYFLGPASVGIYSVSVVLAELLWQIPNAAGFVIFPKAANSTPEAMNNFTPRVFWAILALTITGAIGLAIFGHFFIRLIFSKAFQDAYIPLLLLLPGVVILGAGKVLTSDIAGRGFPYCNSVISGLSFVATIILDLIFIPSMGIKGAALASTASYTLAFLASVVFYCSIVRMKQKNI